MDTVIEFLKGELTRVQNERDAAQANERTLWNVIAELKEQVGMLTGLTDTAREAAVEDEHLRADAFDAIIEKVNEGRTRTSRLMDVRAVAK